MAQTMHDVREYVSKLSIHAQSVLMMVELGNFQFDDGTEEKQIFTELLEVFKSYANTKASIRYYKISSTDGLLPCPNCTSEYLSILWKEYDGLFERMRVRCDNCAYTGDTAVNIFDLRVSWNELDRTK